MKPFNYSKKIKNCFILYSLFLLPFFVIGQCPTVLVDVAMDGNAIAFANPNCPIGGAADQLTGGADITINGITYTASGACDGAGNEIFLAGGAPVTAGPYVAEFPGGVGACSFTSAGIFVPTLSQWGLIVLALLLMSVGTLYATAPTMQLANGQSVRGSVDFRNLPFEKNTVLKLWAMVTFLVAVGFTLAVTLGGYEMTMTDPIGSIIASGAFAYLVFLVKSAEK